MTTLGFDEASPNSMFAAAVASLLLKAADASDSTVKVQLVRGLYTDMVRDGFKVTALNKVAYRAFASAAEPTTIRDIIRVSRNCLDEMRKPLDDRQRDLICIDCITTFGWQAEKLKVAIKSTDIAELLRGFNDNMSIDTVAAIQKGFKRHSSRLLRASVSVPTKLVILTAGVGLGVLSMGVAAPALGGFIGATYLGLSGAAATSAGLALLGGGSIASGGLGMAGGALLVKVTAGVAYKGGTYLATTIARGSRVAFISQLAQLHVATMLSAYSRDESRELLTRLDTLSEQLQNEVGNLEAQREELGRIVLDTYSKAGYEKYEEARDAVKRVKGCLRALTSEQKTLNKALTAPEWVRNAPWADATKLVRLLAD